MAVLLAAAAAPGGGSGSGPVTESLSRFFEVVGAEWVMWLLIGFSVLSVWVMADRFLYLHRRRDDVDALARDIDSSLRRGDVEAALKRAERSRGLAGVVIAAGLRDYGHGAVAVEESMAGALARERTRYERWTAYLGTLGNNAPFIGLLGTVLGVVRAFTDLARSGAAEGAGVVMAGIAEALVATAVGLFVAIPAVMAFNAILRQIKTRAAEATALGHVLLARLAAEAGRSGTGGEKAPASAGAAREEPAEPKAAGARG